MKNGKGIPKPPAADATPAAGEKPGVAAQPGAGRAGVEEARRRLALVLSELNKRIVGREAENKLILTTVVAKENIAVIGPPGTAKSYTFDILAKLLSCTYRRYLMTRFTTDVEVIGPYDIPLFVKEGVLVRKLSQLLEADIAHLDEAFKASSAVLNALLSALQERAIYDPITGQVLPVKTKVFIVTSNEVPREEELQALYDRFPVRVWVDYLYKSRGDETYKLALEARWLLDSNVQPVASWSDVETLNAFSRALLQSVFPALEKKSFIDIYADSVLSLVASLRAQGIVVSDRTIIEKLPKLVAARCAMDGVNVEVLYNAVIDILPHLGRDAEESKRIEKAMLEQMGEVKRLHDKLEEARAKYFSGALNEAKKLLEDLLTEDVEKFRNRPFIAKRASAIMAEARALYEKIERHLSIIESEREGV